MLPYYSQSWMMYHQQYYQQQQQQQQQQQTTSNQYQNPWYSSNYQQQQQTDLLPSSSALSSPLPSTSQAYYPQQQQEQQQQYWGQFQQYNNYYNPSATPYQYSNNYEQCENNETPSTSITSGPLSENSTSTIESETTNKRLPYKWLESSSIEEKPGRTRTKEKYRAVYTDFQRIELEKEFHCQSRYITVQRKLELSKFLGLSERQIKIWFQNRRAKERRQAQRQTPNRHPNRELPSTSTSINQENCYNFRRSNNSTITTNSIDFDSTQNLQSEQNHTIVTESPNTFSNFYQNQISDIGTNRNHSSHNYNRNNIKNEQEFDDNSMLDFEFVDVQETN